MVKVTGRTQDAGTLRAHLDSISRNGELELEGRDCGVLTGRAQARDIADAWSETARLDRRTRTHPTCTSIRRSAPAAIWGSALIRRRRILSSGAGSLLERFAIGALTLR